MSATTYTIENLRRRRAMFAADKTRADLRAKQEAELHNRLRLLLDGPDFPPSGGHAA